MNTQKRIVPPNIRIKKDYQYNFRILKKLIRKSDYPCKFQKILTKYVTREHIWPILHNSSFDLKINKIKYRISSEFSFKKVNLRDHTNLLIGEVDELNLLFFLLRKLFLFSENRELEDLLLIFKKKLNLIPNPEIIIKINVNNQQSTLGYRYNNKEEYFINNVQINTKTQYFNSLINILKYKDYDAQRFSNWSNANTRLKKLEQSFFIDIYSSNKFSEERNELFDLFFEPEKNIILKIFTELLVAEKKRFEKIEDSIENQLNDIDYILKNIQEKLENFKIFEKKKKYFDQLNIHYDSIEEIEIKIQDYKDILETFELNEKQEEEKEILKLELKQKDLEKNAHLNSIQNSEGTILYYNREMRKFYDTGSDLEKEQMKLSKIKIRWNENICYCGKDLPLDKKEEIENTGKCPICKESIDFDIQNEKNKIQQDIEKEKRKITNLSNKIEEEERKIEEFESKINQIELDTEQLKAKIESINPVSMIPEKKEFAENKTDLLERYKWDFPELQEYKKKLGILEKKKELSQVKRLNLNNKLKIIKSKIRRYNNLVEHFETYIKENNSEKDKLKLKFDNIQGDTLRKYLGKIKLPYSFLGHRDFSEIKISVKTPEIERNITHLNYFISLLTLNLSQKNDSIENFHTFPFLVLKDLNKIDILKKSISILNGLKVKYFQTIIFSSNLDIDDSGENFESIHINKIRSDIVEEDHRRIMNIEDWAFIRE